MEKQTEFLLEVINLCKKYDCYIVPACGLEDDWLELSEDHADFKYLLELHDFITNDLPF